MARLNVEGNAMMEELSKTLDFPFRRNGSLVLCFDKEKEGMLEELKAQGEANGVPGLQILTGEEARALEPNLSREVTAALWAPQEHCLPLWAYHRPGGNAASMEWNLSSIRK